MNKDAKQLVEVTLADLNRRISMLKAIGDFVEAEDLERFKREYFVENTDAVTKWTRRVFSHGS